MVVYFWGMQIYFVEFLDYQIEQVATFETLKLFVEVKLLEEATTARKSSKKITTQTSPE